MTAIKQTFVFLFDHFCSGYIDLLLVSEYFSVFLLYVFYSNTRLVGHETVMVVLDGFLCHRCLSPSLSVFIDCIRRHVHSGRVIDDDRQGRVSLSLFMWGVHSKYCLGCSNCYSKLHFRFNHRLIAKVPRF
ncbi:hypothetical protein CBR_g36718 [Chara braunii]|uniref:Uncharacterized protein n=1 Tax=Chara braunii TaxID=69332 RepID=A0A388LL94_CHABU|nr:hypothetical protein CBR_g36718 [Chara braunii]|eukprot:GBG83100.1 hypothetical protein CBR_g36718 [Chara braunii]